MNLEKKVFFLARRVVFDKHYIYLRFDLSAIPQDMQIQRMILHLPLSDSPFPRKVSIREILGPWRKKGIKAGKFPQNSELRLVHECMPEVSEALIDVTEFSAKWRRPPKKNHGIKVEIREFGEEHLHQNPPYLIVDSI